MSKFDYRFDSIFEPVHFTQDIIDKCSGYAADIEPTNKETHSVRGQAESATRDHQEVTGKIGEELSRSLWLRDFDFDIGEPDYKIYERGQKPSGPDFRPTVMGKVKHIHTKTFDLSMLQYGYPPTAMFTIHPVKDKIFNQQLRGRDFIFFWVIDFESKQGWLVATPDWIDIKDMLRPPRKVDLSDSKLCLYNEDYENETPFIFERPNPFHFKAEGVRHIQRRWEFTTLFSKNNLVEPVSK